MGIRQEYERWLMNTENEQEVFQELESIKDEPQAIEDRFYRELAFGTGGLRGVIGAGTNRMNTYTVRKASQGLSDYLNAEFEKPSIAVAYDSRKNSKKFAVAAAEVFAQNGILVHIFDALMPTPVLSFAVRNLSCSGGIVITASHNPAKYNGYKVYGADGCQITLEAADKITSYIDKTDVFSVKHSVFHEMLACGMIRYIGQETLDAYFEAVKRCSVYDKSEEAALKVVYTPLNGTGLTPVLHILDSVGIKDVIVVPEQEKPDENFMTCPYPNPEEKDALKLGVALSRKVNADLLLGTDPDCDRVGTAIRHNGEYILLNGNQMGVLLLDFICSMKKQDGTLQKKPVAVKTIVTTEMAQRVADQYGVELRNVLTGFKFIGEQIGLLEACGEKERYIFGFEESYGYLSGTYARDKDAVDASMLICEMAAYYKMQKKTLMDRMNELYAIHGYFFEKLESFTFEGAQGMQQIQEMMGALRTRQPMRLGDTEVEKVADYLNSIEKCGKDEQTIDLPKSDVLGYFLAGGSSIIIRPSGTEPKIKIYYSLCAKNEQEALAAFDRISRDIHKSINV